MSQSFSKRIASLISEASHEVVFVAPNEAGVPYALQAFSEAEPLAIWFRIDPEDAGDPVAQGNKLSDAVTKALGSPLFGQAMSYQYGLSILRDNLALFEPISFIMSGAEHAEAFANELLSLQTPGSKVVLAFEQLPKDLLLPVKALVLQERDLVLRPEEAQQIAADRLSDTELINCLRMAKDQLEPFLISLNKHLNLPAPMRPSPFGPEAIPGAGLSLPPGIHFQMLLRKEQLPEAFEFAVNQMPEKVLELLEDAGNAFMNKGLYQRFDDLLGLLPDEFDDIELVLLWKMRAAKRLGKMSELKAKVEAFIAEHDAPDLRAVYAVNLAPPNEAFEQAKRAFEMRQSFTTAQNYIIMLQLYDHDKALEICKLQLDIARTNNNQWEVIQALSQPVTAMVKTGRYTESSYLLQETLREFDNYGSGDWHYRLHIINNWSFSRILIGETVGLNRILLSEEKALREMKHPTAYGLRSTIGDYYLSQGDPLNARVFYETNYEELSKTGQAYGRDMIPHAARDYVQCLIHLGEFDQAAAIARKEYYLSNQSKIIKIFNTLAYGMVTLYSDPKASLPLLEEVVSFFEKPLLAEYVAASCIYLAKNYLLLDNEKAAIATLERAKDGLKELSETGFRLFAGPEADFADVFDLCFKRESATVSLQGFGEAQLSIKGKPQKIYPKWFDVLTLLVLHPEGLSLEQLELELEPDGGNLQQLRSIVSKIRKIVPVSRSPYRIELPVQADFVQFEQYLRKGRLRLAMALYRGALNPKSKAPGIVLARETFEEMLRQAVLQSNDPEALMTLSDYLREDLELWEKVLDVLPESDPRRSVALVKHNKVKELWGF